MGGGDSGGTKTTVVEPPSYAVPYLKYALSTGQNLAKKPYQAYGGQELAGLDPNQLRGINMVQKRALFGDPNLKLAGRETATTLGGGYVGDGIYKNAMGNVSSAFKNQFSGLDNKYLQNAIDNTNADVTRTFNQATAPGTDASFARAGAFGGSAWAGAQAENQRQLASELAKNTGNLRYQDYGAQRDLAETYANRQAQDVQSRQSIAENYANRQSQGYQNERQRMMQSVQDANAAGNQRYVDAEALIKAGGMNQEQKQKQLNLSFDKFKEKQNAPTQNLEMFSNLLAKLMGNTGNTSLSKGGGRSGWADAAGTAATLAGLYSKFAG